MIAAFPDAVERADEQASAGVAARPSGSCRAAAIAGDLTEESRNEQAGAGLDKLTPEEFARFTELNDGLPRRHGFPFILAVRGRDKHDILDGFQRAPWQPPDAEFATALGAGRAHHPLPHRGPRDVP